MTSQNLSGKIQTVLGLIEPSELGKTLLHEHILTDIRPPSWKTLPQIGEKITLQNRFEIDYGEVIAPGNCVLKDEETAIEELIKLKEVGGNSIVELSCGGLHPDPLGLKRISEATGLNIIMGCGYYVDEYQDPQNRNKTSDDFANDIINQVTKGAWNTDIKAGIIGEIGCQSPWTDLEKTVMHGAIIAQNETGAALAVHPGRHPKQPKEVADFILKHNGNITRSIISHIDRTIFDDDTLFELADTGVVLEFDLFGMETSYYKMNEEVDMPNDGARLKTLRKLISRGHLEQIAISHDICFKTRLCNHGGHGYGHIFRNVLPMMKRRGFTDFEISTIIETTPKRLLSFK